jgi:hypothetical protein
LQLSSNVRFNRCSKIHVDEDSSQHEAKAMWNLMNTSEKVWKKLREFGDFSVWIWKSDCDYPNSVMINPLYDVLITLLNKISKIQVD